MLSYWRSIFWSRSTRLYEFYGYLSLQFVFLLQNTKKDTSGFLDKGFTSNNPHMDKGNVTYCVSWNKEESLCKGSLYWEAEESRASSMFQWSEHGIVSINRNLWSNGGLDGFYSLSVFQFFFQGYGGENFWSMLYFSYLRHFKPTILRNSTIACKKLFNSSIF